VKLYLPKSTFSEDHISAPKGCCAPKFLHMLENKKVLLAHPLPGTGVLLTIFSKRGSKIALKFDISMPAALTVKRVPHMTAHKVCMITYVRIWEPAPQKFWRTKK